MESKMEEWKVTEPWLDAHCALGEGPYYEKSTNSLRFVDIKKKQVHCVLLAEGPSSLKTTQLDVPVTVTADIEGQDPQAKILLGLKYGIGVLDRESGKYEYVTKFSEESDNDRLRSNDGAADPHGRFWLGTMTDFGLGDFQPEGSLFRFDWGTRLEAVRTGLTIPNSIGWSPDNRTMYYTHSTTRTIFAVDYSAAHGSISNERVFYQHPGSGDPDGFRVDVKGNLWSAVYGESRVLKISPEGKHVGNVWLPTKNITCPQFVGTDLYITSAADEDGEGDSLKYGGAVFKVDVGSAGLEPFLFKLAS